MSNKAISKTTKELERLLSDMEVNGKKVNVELGGEERNGIHINLNKISPNGTCNEGVPIKLIYNLHVSHHYADYFFEIVEEIFLRLARKNEQKTFSVIVAEDINKGPYNTFSDPTKLNCDVIITAETIIEKSSS